MTSHAHATTVSMLKVSIKMVEECVLQRFIKKIFYF